MICEYHDSLSQCRGVVQSWRGRYLCSAHALREMLTARNTQSNLKRGKSPQTGVGAQQRALWDDMEGGE